MENHKKTLAYVIDSDFRIIFSNDELKSALPESRKEQRCYEIFGDGSGPCPECPLNNNGARKTIHFDRLRNEWSNVTSAPIEIPCLGTCHIIINDSIEEGSEYFLYNSAGKPDYAELLELDYLHDSFKIAYHGEWTSEGSPDGGKITTEIRRIAEHSIHPEDRSKFYEFWLLDKIGCEGLPIPLLTTRHGEFRKLRPDGGYDWVQEVLLPIHQTSKNEIFVNNFFNVIGRPSVRQGSNEPSIRTALSNRDEFFRKAAELLARTEQKWCMIAIDVERLKLFNEWYGRTAGDELLIHVSKCLQTFQNGVDRIAGHFYDDDFAFLMPYDGEVIQQLCSAVSGAMAHSKLKMNILPAFGVYRVDDPREPVFSIYDRAKLACASVKGNFAKRIKFFDHHMLENLQSEYLLLTDVQQAFRNREFTFFLQPKCNISSGKIVGAEALARWQTAEKGMVSPGIFVPFLEKSGLISELDTYIWEEVCAWQRSMLDRGMQTLPISVNVSKIDIYTLNVPAYFQDLIERYQLPLPH